MDLNKLERGEAIEQGDFNEVIDLVNGESDTLRAVYKGARHDAGKERNSTMHTFETADGTEVDMWGKSVLDSKLRNIEPGTPVEVVYEGEKRGKSGRRYHDFAIYTLKAKGK